MLCGVSISGSERRHGRCTFLPRRRRFIVGAKPRVVCANLFWAALRVLRLLEWTSVFVQIVSAPCAFRCIKRRSGGKFTHWHDCAAVLCLSDVQCIKGLDDCSLLPPDLSCPVQQLIRIRTSIPASSYHSLYVRPRISPFLIANKQSRAGLAVFFILLSSGVLAHE